VLQQIITDTQPHDLWLVADNRRAASFYRRHGFQLVRREPLGHRMLLHRTTGSEAGPTSSVRSSS
jgi:hypothetical protein